LRCVGKDRVYVEAVVGLVGPGDVGGIHGVCHRFDTFDVQFIQFLDVVEDRGKLRGEVRDLFIRQRQPTQFCDMSDLCFCELIGHGSRRMR